LIEVLKTWIKLYAKALPVVFVASISACLVSSICLAIFTNIVDGHGLGQFFAVVIISAGTFIIVGHYIMWTALLFLYLPVALLLRNIKYRIIALPIWAAIVCFCVSYLIQDFVTIKWLKIDLETLAFMTMFVGILTGLIHHFLLQKRTI